MENKINVSEILKDCPAGMELDCTMWDSEAKVFLKEVSNGNYVYPIEVIVKYDNTEYLKTFTKYGAFNDLPYCKCVIFPKGKTTWEGFVPPCKFKDGDIIFVDSKESDKDLHYKYIAILKEIKGNKDLYVHVLYSYNNDILSTQSYLCEITNSTTIKFATEKQKEKLFNLIRINGYKWNTGTKTLGKLVEPKFKDEDVFRIKSGKYYLCIRNLFGEFDDIIFHKDDTYYSPKDGYLIPSNSNIPCKVEYCVDEYFRPRETKTLIEPKFKVGDKIKTKVGTSTTIETKSEKLTIIEIKSDGYILEEVPGKFSVLPFVAEDYWELVPNKFDITTLKPFESRVLMRSSNAREWVATFYSHKNNNNFYGCGMCCDQCIPYEGNEHLLGTTDDCDEFYKIWK